MSVLFRILSGLLTLAGAVTIFVIGSIYWLGGNMGRMPHEARFANALLVTAVVAFVAGLCTFWRPVVGAGVGLAAGGLLAVVVPWGFMAVRDFARTQAPSYFEQREAGFFFLVVSGAVLLASAGLAWWLRAR